VGFRRGQLELSIYIYYIMIDIWSELKEAIGVSSFTFVSHFHMHNTEYRTRPKVKFMSKKG